MRINDPRITPYKVFLKYLNTKVPKIHLLEEKGWKDGSIHDFINTLKFKDLIELYNNFNNIK